MAWTKEERAEYDRKYRAENAEKLKVQRAKWREENPDKVKARLAKWKKENREKVKASQAKWLAKNVEKEKARNAKGVAELKDYYIKGVLVAQGFPKESITPELIELKRITLKTSRLCLQLKN